VECLVKNTVGIWQDRANGAKNPVASMGFCDTILTAIAGAWYLQAYLGHAYKARVFDVSTAIAGAWYLQEFGYTVVCGRGCINSHCRGFVLARAVPSADFSAEPVSIAIAGAWYLQVVVQYQQPLQGLCTCKGGGGIGQFQRISRINSHCRGLVLAS
jgi:hypothetical protein